MSETPIEPIEPIATEPRWESLRRKGEEDQAPPFSVRYLFIAMTFSAVHMAFLRMVAADQNVRLDGVSTATGLMILQSVIYGVAYTGAVLLVVRVLGRANWTIEPGHWILAAIGFAAAAQTSAEFVNYLAPRHLLAAMNIHLAALGVGLTAPLLGRSTPPHWKVAIAVLLLIIWGRLWMVVQASAWSLVPPIAMLSFIALAVWLDKPRWGRGWLHWSGVVIWVGTTCLPTLATWVLR